MAFVCPQCHTPKPATSPRCPNCTQEVGIIAGLVWNLVAGAISIFLFFWIIGLFLT